MDASVLIATYNRAGLLRRTLEALAQQRTSAGLRWEIVVVDNNSRDHTRAVVEEFGASAPVPVQYGFEGVQGKSSALNAAIDLGRGSVLCLTDDDCRPDARWVQGAVDALAKWDADVVGGRIVPCWASSPPGWLAAEPHLKEMLALLEDATVRRVTLTDRQRGGFRLWGANMSVRRSAFDAVGRFNPNLGNKGARRYVGEDTDFMRRVLGSGRTAVFDPDLVVEHWVPPERMTTGYFRRYALDRAEGIVLSGLTGRTCHVLGVRPYLLKKLAADVLRWCGAVLRHDPEAFCRQLDALEDVGYLRGFVKQALAAREYASLRRRAMEPGA